MSERDLRRWCRLANRAGRNVCGYRNSCIATSHALAAFLRSRGLEADPFRAEVHVWTGSREIPGFVLGSSGDGSRRPAAGPGMWHGHLAVRSGEYVLDPTIDQAAAGKVRLKPAVFAVPADWDDDVRYFDWNTGTFRWEENGLAVSYGRYYRQVGWKSAGDARPSRWRDIAAEMEFLSEIGWH